MTKIIEIEYHLKAVNGFGEPCKNIETQVQEIFNNNKNYKYVDLIYKPKDNYINRQCATLIIEVV